MEIGIALAVLSGVALVVEIYTSTFYLLAVAMALAVGSAVAFMGLASSWAFGAVGVTALLGLLAAHLMRQRLLKRTTESVKLAAEDTGNLVRVESVSVEGLRVAYRGSVWQGRLIKGEGGVPVAPGDMLRIAGREGNDLLLASINKPQNVRG